MHETSAHVAVVPPHPGMSITTGKADATTAAPMLQVTAAVKSLRTAPRSQEDREGAA